MDIPEPTRHQKYSFKSKGRVYCAKACGMAYIGSVSKEIMARTNHKYASARMKANNPMSHPESVQKMKDTFVKIGHKPSIQGGNGRGPTIPEQILSNALGWETNVIVKTFCGRKSGYPTHYKLDVANWDKKVCIEVDGSSHSLLTRKAQDQKKEKYLQDLGWLVLRFSNKEVLENLNGCLLTILAKMSGWCPC
jgi:hypothetical protein